MTDATPMALPGFTADAPKGARKDADFYPTPYELLRQIEPVMRARLAALGSPVLVEPACGDGRMLAWLCDLPKSSEGAIGCDIRPEAVEQTEARVGDDLPECTEVFSADWLTWGGDRLLARSLPPVTLPECRSLAIVSNPPFCIAADFVRTCIARAQRYASTGRPPGERWMVAMLLRVTFLEPTVQDRRAQLHADHPCDVWIPTTRVSFTDGGNDSATTAWFIWPPEDPQQVGHRVRYLGRHKPGGAP